MKGFYRCTVCGKKLIRRLPNGMWRFEFGRDPNGDFAPVTIEIFGQIRMKCIRRKCRRENPDHWNVFTFFPPGFSIIGQPQSPEGESDSED
jgi:hypothetical protein